MRLETKRDRCEKYQSRPLKAGKAGIDLRNDGRRRHEGGLPHVFSPFVSSRKRTSRDGSKNSTRIPNLQIRMGPDDLGKDASEVCSEAEDRNALTLNLRLFCASRPIIPKHYFGTTTNAVGLAIVVNGEPGTAEMLVGVIVYT